MTSRRRILIVLTVVFLASVLLLALQSRLPMHDGRDLASWLQIGYGVGMTHEPADKDEADVAVRADGVCELREPAVLPRGHERGPRVCVGWWRFSELVEVAAEEPTPVIARIVVRQTSVS